MTIMSYKPKIQGPNNVFKIMLLGDGGVGKTTLVLRYLDGKFKEDTQLTIGMNVKIKNLSDLEDSKGIKHNITLQIWDLGGQERFKYIRNLYYPGAKGAILVYDATRLTTYNNLGTWLDELYSYADPTNNKTHKTHIPVVLLGNKVDLVEDKCVYLEDMREWAHKNGISCYETSAKTGVNVEESFTVLAKEILDKSHYETVIETKKAKT